MDIYPDLYLDSVKNINPELLRKNNIKGLIIDVDNTLIDYDRNLIEGAESWSKNLKDEGIRCIILSNIKMDLNLSFLLIPMYHH